jgi:HAE1 family hydrophobic/amphiphilic exporter-1
MVQKQSGTNTVEVAQRVKDKLRDLGPTLPSDVKLFTVFDTSKDITDALKSLSDSLWMAIVLVIVVVWFFLREFKPSMIIALTIPFSLLISFLYLFLSGRTINIIGLSSLAIASGMVVDNAIVIVDNVYRKLERGQRVSEASIFGASEMFLSIAASTLTTVVVFLPVLHYGVVGSCCGTCGHRNCDTFWRLYLRATSAPCFFGGLKQDWREGKGGRCGPAVAIFSTDVVAWERFYSRLLARVLGS